MLNPTRLEKNEALMRSQRRMLLFFAAVTLVFTGYEVQIASANALRLGIVRGISVIAVGVLWFALPRVSIGGRPLVMMLTGLTAPISLSTVALVQGDHHTTYVSWLFALPFALIPFLKDQIRPVVVSGVVVLGGAATILHFSNATSAEKGQWLGSIAASVAIAVYASWVQRRYSRDEALVDQARLEALERLKTSEKLLAEAERRASVGQLAAGVAHEINNPLGFVHANLSYLQDELANPNLDLAEVRTVLEESQVGVKRIGLIVAELTAFARAPNAAPAPAPDQDQRLSTEGRYSIGLELIRPFPTA